MRAAPTSIPNRDDVSTAILHEEYKEYKEYKERDMLKEDEEWRSCIKEGIEEKRIMLIHDGSKIKSFLQPHEYRNI